VALAGLTDTQVRRVVIAYEPIWAIGTGKTATAEQAGEVCTHIRTIIRKQYGARVARAVTIQYGGSMNAKNAHELLAQPDIDGGLIGVWIAMTIDWMFRGICYEIRYHGGKWEKAMGKRGG